MPGVKEIANLIRIIGIDPGSLLTGYGIIETDGIKSHYIAHGVINTKSFSLPERLGKIYKKLDQLIGEWQPYEAAIEDVFISRNAASALKLGQARGAAICACVNNRLVVSEYAARSVKQAVVGTGAAAKNQIQHMVKIILNLQSDIQSDAADALAVAICHAHSRKNKTGISLPAVRRKKRRL